jgi:hypothetical protein
LGTPNAAHGLRRGVVTEELSKEALGFGHCEVVVRNPPLHDRVQVAVTNDARYELMLPTVQGTALLSCPQDCYGG